MSVVQNPIIGRAKQKLGGVVFTTWKGINVLKGKPLTVANPRTDKQLMRRSALIQTMAIARVITGAISLGFLEQAFKKSAFNAFVSYTLRNGFDYANPPIANLVASSMLVSQGTIAPTAIDTAVADQSLNSIVLTWEPDNVGPGQSQADQAIVVAYNATKLAWQVSPSFAARANGTASFLFTAGFLEDQDGGDVFLFFYNSTSRKSSDSITTGFTVIP